MAEWLACLTANGVFTLPDTEIDTDTDKKWVIKYCVEVFTLHWHNNAIEYCYNLLVLVSVSVSGRTVWTHHKWEITHSRLKFKLKRNPRYFENRSWTSLNVLWICLSLVWVQASVDCLTATSPTIYYRPPTKLWEGNVFTSVSVTLSGDGVGISGPRSLPGGGGRYVRGGYVH